ncbi:unnamed protein product [Chrysoparadoxa australica]
MPKKRSSRLPSLSTVDHPELPGFALREEIAIEDRAEKIRSAKLLNSRHLAAHTEKAEEARRSLDAAVEGNDDYIEEVRELRKQLRRSQEHMGFIIKELSSHTAPERGKHLGAIPEKRRKHVSRNITSTREGAVCRVTLYDKGEHFREVLWTGVGLLTEGLVPGSSRNYPALLCPIMVLPSAFAAEHAVARFYSIDGSNWNFESKADPDKFFFPPAHVNTKKLGEAVAGIAALEPHKLMKPFRMHATGHIHKDHPYLVHLGLEVTLVQPPKGAGGAWVTLKAEIFEIDENFLSLRYRVNPTEDIDLDEGCPIFKMIDGELSPVGLHKGRNQIRPWTHEGILLVGMLTQLRTWLEVDASKRKKMAQARINNIRTGYRKLLRARNFAHLTQMVQQVTTGGFLKGKGKALSDDDAAALAEVAEARGVREVLIILEVQEEMVVRCQGLKALARLLSRKRSDLREAGDRGAIDLTLGCWRDQPDNPVMQEYASWVLSLLSQEADFALQIGEKGGCEPLLESLKACTVFGGMNVSVQYWVLSALTNLMINFHNAEKIIGRKGEEDVGLASWVHKAFTNGEPALRSQPLQLAGMGCIREMCHTGGLRTAMVMRAAGAQAAVEQAGKRFSQDSPQFANQVEYTLSALLQ